MNKDNTKKTSVLNRFRMWFFVGAILIAMLAIPIKGCIASGNDATFSEVVHAIPILLLLAGAFPLGLCVPLGLFEFIDSCLWLFLILFWYVYIALGVVIANTENRTSIRIIMFVLIVLLLFNIYGYGIILNALASIG